MGGAPPGATFSSTYTKDDNRSLDYHLHQEGTFANGSYSFSSHTLYDERVTDYEYHEVVVVSSMMGTFTLLLDDTSLQTKTIEEAGYGSLGTTS